jgi:hypothetical protein
MPSPDTLALIVAFAFMAFTVAFVMKTPPGIGPRFVRGRRYHREHRARHALPAAAVLPALPAAPMTALETVPDTAVSPFARTA